MDERSQHGYSPQQPQPQHAAPGHAHASPWPGHVPPTIDAPIAGHAPFPGPGGMQQHRLPQHYQHPDVPQHSMPTVQQFQYAANGFVLPGAGAASAAPMSAHGGAIGMPQQPGTAMPMAIHGQPHVQVYAQPTPQGFVQQPYVSGGPAAMLEASVQQPQAWAFPTPNGLQLVQPGASSMVHGTGMQALPGAASTRRLRWETIVPALAVVCLIAAIGLFMKDFDRITGRDEAKAATPTAAADSAEQVDATPSTDAASPDAAAVVAQASALYQKGQFTAAADLLHEVLEAENPDPAAVALHDKVDAASARNTALLQRLAVEKRGQRWTSVIATIGQIEQLRPLDRQLVSLRTRARAAAKQRAAKAAVDRAASKQRSAGPSGNASGGGGGGSSAHTGHRSPPAAGGNTGSSSNVRPPADVPAGSMPAVPNVPNPTGGNPGVVGGGQAAETMCSTVRAARHAGEDHGTC